MVSIFRGYPEEFSHLCRFRTAPFQNDLACKGIQPSDTPSVIITFMHIIYTVSNLAARPEYGIVLLIILRWTPVRHSLKFRLIGRQYPVVLFIIRDLLRKSSKVDLSAVAAHPKVEDAPSARASQTMSGVEGAAFRQVRLLAVPPLAGGVVAIRVGADPQTLEVVEEQMPPQRLRRLAGVVHSQAERHQKAAQGLGRRPGVVAACPYILFVIAIAE